MQTSENFSDWADVSPMIAEILPHTDVSELAAKGPDFEGGVALIAASQDLTRSEAEEVVLDRLMLQREMTYSLAAE